MGGKKLEMNCKDFACERKKDWGRGEVVVVVWLKMSESQLIHSSPLIEKFWKI